MHQRHGTQKSNSRLNRELLLEDDETILFTVKKHLFGLLAIYVGVIVVLLLSALVIAFGLSGNSLEISGLSTIAQAVVLGVVGLVGVLLLIATYIYLENQFVITDRHIILVVQAAVFNRKISQLSLLNVEDVTVEKVGFFATAFNFGTLKIETAGEQKNFVFSYCPDPNFYADAILDARHELIKHQSNSTVNPASPGNAIR